MFMVFAPDHRVAATCRKRKSASRGLLPIRVVARPRNNPFDIVGQTVIAGGEALQSFPAREVPRVFGRYSDLFGLLTVLVDLAGNDFIHLPAAEARLRS